MKELIKYPFLDKPVAVTKQVWSDSVPPLVSISCKTYNHEKYIRDAIEGFLMQETSFKVEILIHDDASTDNNANIIREYEQKFPNLIKATYQVTNQYRKSPKTEDYVQPHIRQGEYLAGCEGDDYWTYPLKLQTQVEALNRHPECYGCFHPAVEKNRHEETTNKIKGNIGSAGIRIISAKEVLERGISFIPTCSLVVRSSVFSKPQVKAYYKKHGYSISRKFFAAALGSGIIYLDKPMAVYRVRSFGSHTERVEKNPELALSVVLRVNQALDECNAITNYQYSREILRIKSKRLFYFLIKNELPDAKHKEVFKKNKKNLTVKHKFFLLPVLRHIYLIVFSLYKKHKK